MPLSMLIARHVLIRGRSALMSTGGRAQTPKSTKAAAWSKARFRIDLLGVGMVSESQSFSVS